MGSQGLACSRLSLASVSRSKRISMTTLAITCYCRLNSALHHLRYQLQGTAVGAVGHPTTALADSCLAEAGIIKL